MPATPPCEEPEAVMVELDPVGKIVLTSGTPDEV
jgi:hypothetical protein